MLSSIAESRRCSALKPTNMVPWSVTVLVGAPNVRLAGFVLELDAVELPAPHHLFLPSDWQRFPRGRVVGPLLQEQDGPSRSGIPLGDQGDLRSVDQAGILGPVDETGQIPVV